MLKKKQKKTDGKATPSKLALMKQIETPTKKAVNVDGTSDAVVKAASVKATSLTSPHKSAKKKQKKNPKQKLSLLSNHLMQLSHHLYPNQLPSGRRRRLQKMLSLQNEKVMPASKQHFTHHL